VAYLIGMCSYVVLYSTSKKCVGIQYTLIMKIAGNEDDAFKLLELQ
jgi:hypothetical protein